MSGGGEGPSAAPVPCSWYCRSGDARDRRDCADSGVDRGDLRGATVTSGRRKRRVKINRVFTDGVVFQICIIHSDFILSLLYV